MTGDECIFLLAAPSARMYVQAAVAAGHQVVALDAFADQETRALAQSSYVVKTYDDGRLEIADFKRVFSCLNLNQFEGFLYGSWLDAAPDLLSWIAARMPIVGNAEAVLKAAKAFDFFAVLDALNIAHPEVQCAPPKDKQGWLAKKLGGAGGLHITRGGVGDYYQREVQGVPVSLLFVADGTICQAIGFNQLFLSPTPTLPYRYAGGVGNVQLPSKIAQQFLSAAHALTARFGLRGINSLDAVWDGSLLYILELNPRLSASMAFYPHLFDAHLQACAGQLSLPQANMGSRAQRILYADKPLEIAPDFAWPSWVSDIPMANNVGGSVKISQNAPICSVTAQADNAEAAQALVLQRVAQLGLSCKWKGD